jgi:DNA recombination protein RmuC
MELLTGILFGVIVALAAISAAVFFFKDKLLLVFPELFRHVNDQLISMADQKLGAKKDEIELLVKEVKEGLKDTQGKLEAAEKDRIGSFEALKQEIKDQRRITEQLSFTAEGLKRVLSSNQLRGQFGEQAAEDLLRMAGFVNGTDYVKNKAQDTTSTRPDFCIFLPDGVKINVDVKFPYSNLVKMTETEDQGSKKEFLKLFERDIKEKVKQLTTRDYINPAENTVDFVIMFIPNEMIFSFIYEKMNDIWSDAMQQKVVMAGPFNFTATLRLIRQSYSNFKYQKNIHKTITLIKIFEEEFKKYNEEFQKIGDRLNSLSEQYDRVNSTRTNVLIKTVDKIKIEEGNANLIPDSTPLIPEKEVAAESFKN